MRASDESTPIVWDDALPRVLGDPSEPRLLFQPIVDLQRGVVAGYEALSRFGGPPPASPDQWFAEANRQGRGVELELRAVERALQARATLPPDTFLTVNVTPAAMLHPRSRELLNSAPALHRLVFEITEHEQVTDYVALREAADRVRAAGGLLAVDDAGAGYASLKHVLELRPDFVKLDRELIMGIDHSPTKRSVVQMLGELTDRIDAWVIAEGIETASELDAVMGLHVPLGQGWVLAKPAPAWASVDDGVGQRLAQRRAELSEDDRVAVLIERRPAIPHDATLEAIREWFGSFPAVTVVVWLDEHERPAALLRRTDVDAGQLRPHPVLAVGPATRLHEVARRAMNRDAVCRFDPMVCRHSSGHYVGIVTIESLVEWLAREG